MRFFSDKLEKHKSKHDNLHYRISFVYDTLDRAILLTSPESCDETRNKEGETLQTIANS